MIVTLDHRERVAHNIETFWFRPEKPLDYIAGQFIELALAHPSLSPTDNKRWFTLSSSPTETLLSITTKFQPESPGHFKNVLFTLKPGDSAHMSEPMGDFVLPKDNSTPLIFVVAGMGLTPLRSMLVWLRDKKEDRIIHVLHITRTKADMVFVPLLQSATSYTPMLSISDPAWEGLVGKPDARRIIALTKPTSRHLIYLSGPEPMIESLYGGMQNQGIKSHQLITDYFPGYTF